MREYESTVPGKYKTGIDPDKNHTIQQLQEVVAHAVQKHSENDSKGLWGKVNAAFLKLGNNKESINSWLGLLPGESEYMSVVCGGFKLILEACRFPLLLCEWDLQLTELRPRAVSARSTPTSSKRSRRSPLISTPPSACCGSSRTRSTSSR